MRFRFRLGHAVAAPLLAISALAMFAMPSHAANEIVIGQVAPLTGVIAGTGDEYSSGAAAYFASVNAKGGIYGRKVRVVLKDDSYKPETTLALTREIAVMKGSTMIARMRPAVSMPMP